MATGNMSAMASGDEHVAEVLRGLVRHLNCLNEDNKATRKRALEAIKKETIDNGLSGGALQEVFSCLLKPLLKCTSDPMERCRETAILMLTDFIRCVPRPEDSLVYLVPCLTQRLGGKEIVEPAEELRLSGVELLSLTVEVCGKQLAPYLDDVIKILQVTIVDPCPDVKRESCRCTVLFAKSVPGGCTHVFGKTCCHSSEMRFLICDGSVSVYGMLFPHCLCWCATQIIKDSPY